MKALIAVCVVFLLCLVYLDFSHGQVIEFGKCVRPKVQPNFDKQRYLGRWYGIQYYYPIYFQLNDICVTATYSENPDGSVRVVNKGLNKFSRQPNVITGKAVEIENAKLKVGFGFNEATPPGNPESNYWILETDYDTYSIVYSCTDYYNIYHTDMLWILGRQRTLSPERILAIYDRLQCDGIRLWPLRKDGQFNEIGCDQFYASG